MKQNQTYWILFFVLLLQGFPFDAAAQSGDTLRPSSEFITDQLESLSRSSDLKQDYSDLTGNYIFYARHPININGPETDKLVQLHLLNEMQLVALKNYIHKNGIIYSLYELQYISGFNRNTIQQLSPFIRTGPPGKTKPFSWKKAIKYGDHQVLMRYGQLLETEAGYQIPADSAWLKPGSVFLGTPQKLYFRYAFRSNDHLRWGFTAEKDAGEMLLPSGLSDSVKHILGNHKPSFPDFFSAYAYVSNLGILKKAVIGDYHLEFGQGLCLWSGLTFGKSAEATSIKYYGTGIKPNTSSNENRFFRGAAVTLGLKKIALTFFYSHNKIDGSFFVSPSGQNEITSLLETGNHRTINELLNKHRLMINAFGGHAEYARRRWKVGLTYYQTRFGLPLEPVEKPYRLFYFRGKKLSNTSMDLSFLLKKMSFFGELAANPSGGGWAGMAGVNLYPADRLTLTLSYRNFSPAYKVLYASPFRESGQVNNEHGIYLGLKMLLSRMLTLTAYADYYTFPWLKYHINAPSSGKAFLAQLDMNTSQNLSMYFRFRYGQREENNSLPEGYYPLLTNKKRSDFRYAVTYSVVPQLILKTRIEYVHYVKVSDREKGFLIYQDILYRLLRLPLNISFRYAWFNTDGWNSRIYAYENDVLYAFTIPPFYDNGQRVYLLLHYRIKKFLDLWMKIARTVFFNKKSISSGPEAIQGNHKTSIKFQIQIKL